MGVPGELKLFWDTSLKIGTVPENPGQMFTLDKLHRIDQAESRCGTAGLDTKFYIDSYKVVVLGLRSVLILKILRICQQTLTYCPRVSR